MALHGLLFVERRSDSAGGTAPMHHKTKMWKAIMTGQAATSIRWFYKHRIGLKHQLHMCYPGYLTYKSICPYYMLFKKAAHSFCNTISHSSSTAVKQHFNLQHTSRIQHLGLLTFVTI